VIRIRIVCFVKRRRQRESSLDHVPAVLLSAGVGEGVAPLCCTEPVAVTAALWCSAEVVEGSSGARRSAGSILGEDNNYCLTELGVEVERCGRGERVVHARQSHTREQRTYRRSFHVWVSNERGWCAERTVARPSASWWYPWHGSG
jgi:hypothetical protein